MAKRSYSDLTKTELIQLLEARDRRDATRFGLVWEANEIERDKALNQDFVALDLDQKLSCGKAPWKNLIIEGDNFDALRYLRMTFAGRIKCIYIDPPYNTGNNDFVYNDRFVDKEDQWRHSKWCEFMFQRLTLAKDLLSQDGVMFVHIGEDELHSLGGLLDQIFRGRKVGTFVWRTRNGANDSKEYFRSIDHEYILCVANPSFAFGGHSKELADYSNPDNDRRGLWVSSDLCKGHNYRVREGTYYAIQNPNTGVWYPANPDRVWAHASGVRGKKPDQRMAAHIHHHFQESEANSRKETYRSETMAELFREQKILWPEEEEPVTYASRQALLSAIRAGKAPANLREDLPDLDFWVGRPIGWSTPRRKKFVNELKKLEKPLSTWIVPSSDKEQVKSLITPDADSAHIQTRGTSDGTTLLRQILGNTDFAYPKPLPLVHGLLQQATDSESIVLDFFAGSGTTAHAVHQLNDEDNGNRRVILVSSTECTSDKPKKNICRDVCATRIRRVIEGYGEIQALSGDFAYLRCRRIRPGDITDVEHEQVWIALQLTHMPAVIPFDYSRRFMLADHDGTRLIYVPHLKARGSQELLEAAIDSPSTIVYTWQPELVRQRLTTATNTQVEAVPEVLAQRFGLRI